MILQILIDFENALVTAILGIIPKVTLASIPVIGTTIQSTLTTAVTSMNAFIVTFPYAGIVWNLFLLGVLPLEIGLIVLKFFLGNRTPAKNM